MTFLPETIFPPVCGIGALCNLRVQTHSPDYLYRMSGTCPDEIGLPVTGNLTLLQAFGLTAGMGVLATAFIGLVMLCLSLCLGRVAALSGASVLAVPDFLITEKLPFWCYRLSPSP